MSSSLSPSLAAFLIFVISLGCAMLFVGCTVVLTHGVWLKWIDRQRFPLLTEAFVDLVIGGFCLLIGYFLIGAL